MDDEVAAEFAEDVLGMMPDPKTWTQKNLEDVVDLIKYDSDLVDKIPIETLAKGMSAIEGDDFDDTEVGLLFFFCVSFSVRYSVNLCAVAYHTRH